MIYKNKHQQKTLMSYVKNYAINIMKKQKSGGILLCNYNIL